MPESDTSALVAFLEARLAEDEQWAAAASAPYEYAAEGATVPPGGVHWTWVVGENWTPVTVDPVGEDKVGGPDHYGHDVNLASVEKWPSAGPDHGWPVRMMPRVVANSMVEVDSSAAGHIARHDPARVLREVEAKRTMLAVALAMATPVDLPPGTSPTVARLEKIAEATERRQANTFLKLLAASYVDHPDFNPQWLTEENPADA